MQKGAGRTADDPAKIGRALTALIQRLERVETDDARLRDMACERLRKGLGFIEELIGAAARDRNDPGPASGPFFNLGGITP